MPVAVFSYWSLLDPVSARQEAPILQTIPCVVPGWSLAWADVRSQDDASFKRFVCTRTFETIPRFAFASVVPNASGEIAGAALVIDEQDLAKFDFRERGLQRLALDPTRCKLLTGEPLSTRMALPLFLYAAQAPSALDAPVSAGYLNMGLRGAKALDRSCPGFWDVFSRRLPWPHEALIEADFLEIAADGKSFVLLDLDSQVQTWLLQTTAPLTPPQPQASPAAWDARARSPYSAADRRNRGFEGVCDLPWFLKDVVRIREGLPPLSSQPHWLKDLARACAGEPALERPADAWAQACLRAAGLGMA